MNRSLKKRDFVSGRSILLEGSKSESNRLLILQGLYPALRVCNIASADDTKLLQRALSSTDHEIDVQHAGTAMRFLTAYFAIQEGRSVMLKGSPRMHQRPIGVLVDALRELGADIAYLEKEGFPPLLIKGKALSGGRVHLRADVSSQFLSALLLIGGKLPQGLEIIFTTACTSLPYLQMTASLLGELGIPCSLSPERAKVTHTPTIMPHTLAVEPDWSSASYLYSMVALSSIGSQLHLQGLLPQSKQGDARVATIFESFGVKTTFVQNGCLLQRTQKQCDFFSYDCTPTPDLAPTLAVTCTARGIPCHLYGLHTLKIKETDRIWALQKELSELGAEVEAGTDYLKITPRRLKNGRSVSTYDDHRMALAFAPLSLILDMEITDSEVVTKSYPLFWEHFQVLTTGQH